MPRIRLWRASSRQQQTVGDCEKPAGIVDDACTLIG